MKKINPAVKTLVHDEVLQALHPGAKVGNVQKIAYYCAVETQKNPISTPHKQVDFYNRPPYPFIDRTFQRIDASVCVSGRYVNTYNKRSGFFDRLFQRPDETISVGSGCLDIFEKKPNLLLGSLIHQPDKSVEIQDSRIKVYDKPPSLFWGRIFQQPVIEYKMHDKGLDVYEKPDWKQWFLDTPNRSIVVKEC